MGTSDTRTPSTADLSHVFNQFSVKVMPPTRAKSKPKTTNDICPSCSTPANCCPHHPPKGADTDNVTPTQTQLKNSHNNDDKSLTKEESITMKTPLNLSGPKPMDNASGPYSQFLEARYGISPSVQLSESKKHLNFEELGEQIQTTKLNDMLCLSPMLDQMKTDVAHSINDAICSPNKELHGSINSLQMQELLAHSNVKTDFQDEILIQKLKTSIFVDVKGMSEEIVTSISTAAYDILQEVFSNAVPQILQENEILKSTLANLLSQVSELRKEILEIKNSQASFPVYPKHTSQEKVLVPEADSDYVYTNINIEQASNCQRMSVSFKNQADEAQTTVQCRDAEENPQQQYSEEFPLLPNSREIRSTAAKGWAMAVSKLPSSSKSSQNSLRLDKKKSSLNLILSGNFPSWGDVERTKHFLVDHFNTTLCPILSELEREILVGDLTHIIFVNKKGHHSSVIRFASANVKNFVFKNRKKLLDLSVSHADFPKLYLSPWLDSEDAKNQQKIVRAFNALRTKENDSFNYNVFPQGYAIKIISKEGKKMFYSFDCQLSPKDFLVSKGFKV